MSHDPSSTPTATAVRLGPVKVSVIVAVHNPGTNIDELLTSIDEQSLPTGEFEVIFVDDDSTDGSRERLVKWAAHRPHVQVLHNTPNSGWPGRPRNLGIDAAAGEFLFFADNDDKLASRALEWMYDYATQHQSDVVIPKLVGIGPGRGVPRQLFRRNIADAELGKDPILGILTPHKLVRTSMVREHGIRFPEGRIRLEDHYFIVSCYFAASRISVLADRVCYYWMRRIADGDNASFAPVDPEMYYQCIERILEVVEQHTEPGRLRAKLYAHWYEGKMLSRLRGGSLLAKEPAYQQSLLRELRRLSARFGLGRDQWPWLGAGGRLRSHLVEHGTLEQIQVLAAAERGVTQQCELDEIAWTDDDRLRVRLHARLVHHDGQPVRLRHDGGVHWDPAELVPSLGLPRIDITDLYPRIRQHVMVADRHTSDVVFVPGCSSEAVDGDVVATRAEVTIDPATVSDGDGAVMDLRSRVVAAGWTSEQRVPVGETVVMPEKRTIDGVRVRPYATKGFGNLSIEVGRPSRDRSSPDRRGGDAATDGPRARAVLSAHPTLRRLRGRARSAAGRVRRRVARRLRRN